MPAFFVKGLLDLARPREIDHLVDVFRSLTPRFEKERVTIGLENYLSAEQHAAAGADRLAGRQGLL